MPEVRSARRTMRQSHLAEGAAFAMRRLGLSQMSDSRARLHEVALGSDGSIPMCFVTGGNDLRYTELAAELVDQVLPRAAHVNHVTIGGAGHDVTLEAPARWQTTLTEFLQRHFA